MISFAHNSDEEKSATENQQPNDRLHLCALALAGIVIITSAFHFWPYEDNKTWQMLCPPNLVVFIWIPILIGYTLLRRKRQTFLDLLPHISIFAYLIINLLSGAFATDLGRAATYTAKLALMLIGGYMLFNAAISNRKSLHIVFGLITTAVIIALTWCLSARFGFGSGEFGSFDSPYKYGTYIGTLVPLCAAYLFMSPRHYLKLLAAAIVIGAIVSAGTIGLLAAITIGLTVFVVIIQRWSVRIYVITSLVCGLGLVAILSLNPNITLLRDDIKLAEKDGTNLKQRYIEWQAELNLMEERTVTGTAAGCINVYRSNYYYRLPKLNTLKAFDQNGWLATGAETGIFGLVCFGWIIVYYFKQAYQQLDSISRLNRPTAHRFAAANFTGLSAACAANLFSSVHYNGVVIVFVLVLALVYRTNLIFTGD
jgi:MFS family permease